MSAPRGLSIPGSFTFDLNLPPQREVVFDHVNDQNEFTLPNGIKLSPVGCIFPDGTNFNISKEEFEIHEPIGSGQFACVYRAFHKPTQRWMALKQVDLTNENLTSSSNWLKYIQTELIILRQSEHTNFIIDFYGAFYTSLNVYYCVEYMDYGSLDKLKQYGPASEEVLAKIAYCMTSGLEYLHSVHQVIHRDVKPTNVVVKRDGQIKLCDFGISGFLHNSKASTFTGCEIYMAPERIDVASQDLEYTIKADVWSLGVCLLEVALAKFPYPRQPNIFFSIQKIIQSPPPTLPDTFSPDRKSVV